VSAPADPIAGNDLFRLFPTPVWIAELDAASRDAVAEIVDTVAAGAAAAGTAGDGRAPAAEAAWRPRGGLHRLPELAPLVDVVLSEALGVLASQHVQHGPLEVTSCVAEAEAGDAARPFRMIANAFLAGLYVARAPAQGCAVEFEDPRAQAHIVAPPRTVAEPPDAPLARVVRGAGALLIFPAWMRHRVRALGGGGACVTVSLGVLFGEFADTIARPKWRGDAV